MPSSARTSASPSPSPPTPTNASQAAQQAPAFTNILPHAGHHADLQLINGMVNELCEVHATNRRAMDEMIAKYEELRIAYEEAMKLIPRGIGNRQVQPEQQQQHQQQQHQQQQHQQQQQQHQPQQPSSHPSVEVNHINNSNTVNRAEYEALAAQLHRFQDNRADLLDECEKLRAINTSYEDAMAMMLDKVRNFSHAHTTTLIAWHKYYNGIIQQLRDESLQKSLEHSRWQEGLGRLNTYVRSAFKSYCEGANPLYNRIAYLKRENEVMRGLLGWPEEDDPDGEREDGGATEFGMERARDELDQLNLAAGGNPAIRNDQTI